MSTLYEQINALLSTTEFQKILKNDMIRIGQLNAIIAILIQACIPFNLQYSPATRQSSASASLTITINPSTNLQFTISFS